MAGAEKVGEVEYTMGVICDDRVKDRSLDQLIVYPAYRDAIKNLLRAEYSLLYESIKQEGIRDPLWIEEINDDADDIERVKELLPVPAKYNKYFRIVDGHHRYEIAQDLSFNTVPTKTISFNSVEEGVRWIIQNQLSRRNLTDELRAYYVGKLYSSEKKENGDFDRLRPLPQNGEVAKNAKNAGFENSKISTAKKIANKVGVSKNTVERAYKFAAAIDRIEKVSPEAAQKVLDGKSHNSVTKGALEALANAPDADIRAAAVAIVEDKPVAPKPEAGNAYADVVFKSATDDLRRAYKSIFSSYTSLYQTLPDGDELVNIRCTLTNEQWKALFELEAKTQEIMRGFSEAIHNTYMHFVQIPNGVGAAAATDDNDSIDNYVDGDGDEAPELDISDCFFESEEEKAAAIEKMNAAKKSTPKKPVAVHKSYGANGWVKLTDEQYGKLITEFGEEYITERIAWLDEYVAITSNKNKYKDWNLVMRKMIREKWGEEAQKKLVFINYNKEDPAVLDALNAGDYDTAKKLSMVPAWAARKTATW